MLEQIGPGDSHRRKFLWGSIGAHALLLAWLLHAPEPRLLTASSIAFGRNGQSVTRLFWDVQNPDDSDTSSSSRATEKYRHQRLGQNKIHWRPNENASASALPSPPTPAEDQAKTETLSKLGHGAAAGSSYGTLARGLFSGDEIRPAIPTTTSDPVVYPWQLPLSPGNEVIEITIDERGDIIRKTVLNSLGPAIDAKCLAALDNWHFQPARQNGVAIASKQDAVFPFKARGQG